MTSTSFHIDFCQTKKNNNKKQNKYEQFYIQLSVVKKRRYTKCHQTGIAKIEPPLQMDLMQENDDKTITIIPPPTKNILFYTE